MSPVGSYREKATRAFTCLGSGNALATVYGLAVKGDYIRPISCCSSSAPTPSWEKTISQYSKDLGPARDQRAAGR